MAAIKEAADRLVARQYSIGVDTSDLESDRLVAAALNEQLDGLATGAEDAGTALDDMGAKADGAGGSLDNLGRSASGAAGSGGAGGGGLGGLVGAALLLGPALVPIGAVAAASIGGIAAMGVQAAAGLGVFALAAKPVITDLNTAATAQQKYSTAVQVSGASSTQARTALVALQTALSQLTPAEQAAAVGFGNFKAAYLSWAQSFDPTILPLLAGGITIAKTAMTEFVPIVASVGKALGGVESSIQAALSSGFATRFLTVFGGQSSAAITTFSNLLIGVGKAAAGLDLAFSPLIDRIEAGLNGLATNLGNFGASAQGSAGIQSFIAYVEKEGPVVGATIEQIGKDIAILARDLAPLGASYLSGLELIAKAIGVIGTLSPGLVQTAAALLTLGKASQILNSIGPLTAVTSGIKDIASVAAVSGIRNTASGLVTLGVSAGGVIGSLGALGITLGEVAGPAGLAAAALISLTGIMSKGLDQQAGGASQFTKAFIAGLGNVADPVAAVKAEIASLGTQADAVAKQIDAIHAPGSGTAIDSAQADELHNNLLPALQDLADKQNNLKAALPGLQSAQNAYTTAQRAAATATAAAAAQAQTLTEKLLEAKSPAQGFAIDSQAVASALQAESTDATNLTNSLNVLVGTYLSAQAATLAQKQAVLSFSDALKAAHGDITGNSAASITAQQSANSFATTLYGTMIPALAKQGVSAAQASTDVQSQIAALDASARAAGLTAAQVQALNQTYGLTPKDVSTAFHDSGYAQVIADAHNAKAAFDDFTGTYVAYLKEEVQVSGTPLSLHNAPGSGYPGNAAGTDFHPGGLSWVGEKGPELLNLPRGSQVVPNGKSMDMARAGLISPPGYADGVGVSPYDLGYQFGTQVNSGLNTALASDKHPINLGWQSSAQQAFTQPTSAGAPAFQGWQSSAQRAFTQPTGQASAGASGSAFTPASGWGVGPALTAATAAANAQINAALKTASGDLTKGLAGTTAQLATDVAAAMAQVNKAVAGTPLATVVDALGASFQNLDSKAKVSLASVTTQLSAAQAAVATIQKQVAQNAQTLEGQFSIITSGTTITNPFTGSTWTAPVTSTNIISSLRTDVANLTKYRNLLNTLKSWGLSTELLQELVAAGPASGLATAQALVSGGKAQVSLADVLQGQIDSTSTQIGAVSATATLNGKTVGLAQAQGIVTSLQASKAKITAELDTLAKDMQDAITRAAGIKGGTSETFRALGAQMMAGLQAGIKGSNGPLQTELEAIAKSMEAAIKKALGIKSPSTVFAEVGTNVVQGLAVGISGSQGLANTALDNVWSGLATKSKQKALAFDATAIPVGLGGSGGGPARSITYSPSITVQGDVGPEGFEKKMMTLLDNDHNALIRELARS